jgi:TolA-binding protein
MQDAIRQMQYDTSQLSRNPERVNQLITQLIGGVEQIELRLRRLNEDKQGTSVRSGASQPVPPGYADAVAEYFRRLSKQK